MSLFNGIRKIFAGTPEVPAIPDTELNSKQEIDFVGDYRRFKTEIDKYENYGSSSTVPEYYKELRTSQYVELRGEVAKYVKKLDSNERFQQAIVSVDYKIVFNLLDRPNLVEFVACREPKLIPQLPQAYQESDKVAEHLLQYEVGQVKYLPLKFRNNPEFIYRCLSDDEKFKGPLPEIPPSYHRDDVIKAMGDDLKNRLDWYQRGTIIPQLKQLAEIDSLAKDLSTKGQPSKKLISSFKI